MDNEAEFDVRLTLARKFAGRPITLPLVHRVC
jgi:hypothetical protein